KGEEPDAQRARSVGFSHGGSSSGDEAHIAAPIHSGTTSKAWILAARCGAHGDCVHNSGARFRAGSPDLPRSESVRRSRGDQGLRSPDALAGFDAHVIDFGSTERVATDAMKVPISHELPRERGETR